MHTSASTQTMARTHSACVCVRAKCPHRECVRRTELYKYTAAGAGGAGRHVDTSARACEHGKIGRSGERRRNFNSDIIHVKCGPAGCCRPTTSSMCGRPSLHRRRVCRVCTPSSSPCQTRVHLSESVRVPAFKWDERSDG